MQPDELKALREGSGLTQAQMAAEIGVSRVLLGQMERGQAPIEKRTEAAALLASVKSIVAFTEITGAAFQMERDRIEFKASAFDRIKVMLIDRQQAFPIMHG